jgi:hypothetical protein
MLFFFNALGLDSCVVINESHFGLDGMYHYNIFMLCVGCVMTIIVVGTNMHGILFIGPWVPTQPINIPNNLTSLMDYIKVIFMQDKCPLGQLSYKSI